MPAKRTPASNKLANALQTAKSAAQGGNVLRSRDLPRAQRQSLQNGGWLLKLHQGWYALVNPQVFPGDTVPFYSNFWEFLQKYLDHRLGENYALSPIHSLALHSGEWKIPEQLTIQTSLAKQDRVELAHGISLIIYQNSSFRKEATEQYQGIRVFSTATALVKMPASAFRLPSPEILSVMMTIRDISELLRLLLADEAVPAAQRLADLFAKIGRTGEANQLQNAFSSAGLPFATDSSNQKTSPMRLRSSPAAARIEMAWQQMSKSLKATNLPKVTRSRFSDIEFAEIERSIKSHYTHDAYNSLSIENYHVSPELVERVARGEWDPQTSQEDKQSQDAMAARGYYDAFQEVVASLRKVHEGADPSLVVESDFMMWREHLFSASVKAGLMESEILAGYRNRPVFIRGSRHVPPQASQIIDAMDAMFKALQGEEDPWVKAVLGHFFFVHIHPFSDGNGRTARFLMNVLLVAHGFPWTIIHFDRRQQYFDFLEAGHIRRDVLELSEFFASEMNSKW